MKKILPTALTSCLIAISGTAIADDHGTPNHEGGFTMGLSVGSLDVDGVSIGDISTKDANGNEQTVAKYDDSDTSYGLMLGYYFDKDTGIEFDYIGFSDEIDSNNAAIDNKDIDITINAISLAQKIYFSNEFYLKLKAGYFASSVDADTPSPYEVKDDSDSGFTASLAVGYDIQQYTIQLGYSAFEDNYSNASLGLNYRF